jgi:outer membrane receptor protein involved in Fe transport
MLSRYQVPSLAVVLSLFAWAPRTASAQDAAAKPAATQPQAEAAATAAGPKAREHVEEILVTGSRIRRLDLTTAAPVTVLSKEQIQASGKVSIGDFLQTLPEQANAINTGTNNGGDGAVRISLRSLGTARTLVLLNGRRVQPGGTGADGSVDLNTIPAAVVERIEVLKDGASAVYGSDAISGVVNIITRRNWTGAEATAFAGTSSRGDATIYDVAATAGTSNDKGGVLFSAGYYQQAKSMAGDRDFSKYQWFFDATGANNGAGTLGEYGSGSSRTPGGRVRASGAGNAEWAALMGDPENAKLWGSYGAAWLGKYLIHDGSMTPNAACLAAGGSASNCQWRPMNVSNTAGLGGDLYNFAPFNYLVTPAKRISLWSSGDYKLGDSSRVYFEGTYLDRQSDQQLAPEPLIIGTGGVTGPDGKLVTISRDNYYNPFGKSFSTVSRRLDEFGYRTHHEDVNAFRTVIGIDGSLNEGAGPLSGWNWDTNFNYGRTYSTFTIGGSLQSSRVKDALGPSMLIDGKPACVRTANDPTTVVGGCVPLDLFHGSGSIGQDQVRYLTYTGTSSGFNDLMSYQANLSGELFKLGADRPVALALGYEWRQLGGNFINEPLTAKADTSNGAGEDTAGTYHVNEGYAELSIPLLNGMPGIENLEVSAAARMFKYSTFGGDWTYKFGFRYTPVVDLTFRGTYSTAFRAPSIPDLYAGQVDSFPNISDPCARPANAEIRARCGAAAANGDDSVQLRTKFGGNPDLKPETAKVITAGVVFEPSMIRNLTVTVDYYRIAVTSAISTIGESTILAGCYTTGKQPEYCKLVQRDPANQQINYIYNLNANVGDEKVAGIDLAVRYQIPTEDLGRFGLSFDGTWLQYHDQTLADGTVVKGKGTFDLNSQGTGGSNPEFRFNAGLVWGFEGARAGLMTRFIGGFKECGSPTGDFSGGGLCYQDDTFQRRVHPYNTWDLWIGYDLKTDAGKTSVTAGVQNMFDTSPAKVYNGFANATDTYSYDQLGRYFYLRLAHSI